MKTPTDRHPDRCQNKLTRQSIHCAKSRDPGEGAVTNRDTSNQR